MIDARSDRISAPHGRINTYLQRQAGEPGDQERPSTARQVVRVAATLPASASQRTRIPGYRTSSTAPTRHVTLPAPRPQRATPPLQTAHHAKVKTTAGQDPTKSPHRTRHTGSHQHHTEVPAVTHIRWSEGGLESSRAKTRTWNLPVNRRSVLEGGARAVTGVSPALPA
jgi:hypothetical protein